MICPDDPKLAEIMLMSISKVIKENSFKNSSDVPQCKNGDTFSVETSIGSGQVIIKDLHTNNNSNNSNNLKVIMWVKNNMPVMSPSAIDSIDGKKCAAW